MVPAPSTATLRICFVWVELLAVVLEGISQAPAGYIPERCEAY
jgi:hypothetical protein